MCFGRKTASSANPQMIEFAELQEESIMFQAVYRILFTLFLVFANTVYAQDEPAVEEEEAVSGQELLESCEEGAAPGAPNQYCMRYVFGLVQVVDSFQQAEPDKPKVFCINPNLVSLQEVTEEITDWLKGVPNRLNEDAYKLVTEALHSNYPCSLQNI